MLHQAPPVRHRRAGIVIAALLVMALAACTQTRIGGVGPPSAGVGPSASGEVIGSGSVRVALLVPRSATGNAGISGQASRNAADLAMRDFPGAGIQLVVYDTGGTPAGALAAANAALAEGAEMILGPVFSSSVGAIAPAARQAGVPVIAFTTDVSVAGRGVYLISFLLDAAIERGITYAAANGHNSFAAILPANPEGALVEASFRQTVSRSGGRVVTIERYQLDQNDIRLKATAIAEVASQFDALLVPDAGDVAVIVADTLASAGVSRQTARLIGSGQWEGDSRISGNPNLAGAWYAAPSRQGFTAFAQRYRSAYNSEPPRNATIAYDATVLAAGLVRQFGANRFSQAVLTNPNGFAGIDGVFRLLPDGGNDRRLAVYEVTGSGTTLADPAPRSFAGGT
ncbi:MAG: penicillin-binding protein activator [Hyphomicrobiales bacterium]|nr:penicillin-binding protein activator [Hyphomicrobiales bacterium]